MELKQWLGQARGERKRGQHRAVMDILYEIAPGWDLPQGKRQVGRTASEEARWRTAFDAVGWAGLEDGLVWAEEHNVSWTGVADYLGFEKRRSVNAQSRRAYVRRSGSPSVRYGCWSSPAGGPGPMIPGPSWIATRSPSCPRSWPNTARRQPTAATTASTISSTRSTRSGRSPSTCAAGPAVTTAVRSLRAARASAPPMRSSCATT